LLKSYDDYYRIKNQESADSNKLDVHTERLFALFKKLETSALNIQCKMCNRESIEGSARAYLRSYPFEITLCANRLQHSSDELKEALVHEVTHAYDLYHQRYQFNTCEGLAHTEIRAASNAECAKILPGNLDQKFPELMQTLPFRTLKENCVKKTATSATSNLFGQDQAKVCVEAAWKMASKDVEPQL
jgi:hypothetical protein